MDEQATTIGRNKKKEKEKEASKRLIIDFDSICESI